MSDTALRDYLLVVKDRYGGEHVQTFSAIDNVEALNLADGVHFGHHCIEVRNGSVALQRPSATDEP